MTNNKLKFGVEKVNALLVMYQQEVDTENNVLLFMTNLVRLKKIKTSK